MPSKSPLGTLTLKHRALLAGALLLVAGLVAAARGCREQPQPQQPGEPPKTLANRNVRFGMPADAKADPAHKNAYLLERPQYVLSYNDATKTPNWVCWNLNKSDIGNTPRRTRFEPDAELPKGFVRVGPEDYTGSGFDRGHLCPAKDRSDSEENNRATFLTTNIMPQSPNSNRKGWERFESYCRTLTRDGSELYIAAGPHGRGGTGEFGPALTIGKSPPIDVPAASWKVVLVLPNKDAMPTQTTRALAVWIPNDQTVLEAWQPYAVSVAEVEKRTGYKFFPLVPDDLANPIKNRLDAEP